MDVPRRIGTDCIASAPSMPTAGGSYRPVFFFFFSSRRRHTRLQGDWSSDVCSSDLDVIVKVLVSEQGRVDRRERVNGAGQCLLGIFRPLAHVDTLTVDQPMGGSALTDRKSVV